MIHYLQSQVYSLENCKISRSGHEYRGNVSKTIYGDQCGMWSLFFDPMLFQMFVEESVDEAMNYCRNLYHTIGPGCFTSKNNWEFCLIPLCSEPVAGTYPECKNNRRGIEYRGKKNVSLTGERCLPWNRWPNKFEDIEFPDNTTDEAFNYCRNVDNNRFGPWCLTKSHNTNQSYSFGTCGIPICGLSNERNNFYLEMNDVSFIKTTSMEVADAIVIGMYPMLMLSCLISNSLSIAVLRRPALVDNITAFLLILLAIMDTLALFIGAFPRWLVTLLSFNVSAHNDLSCKVYNYLYYIIMGSPGWIIIVITVERYLAIAKPHKAKSMYTMKKTGLALLVILLCIFLMNIPVIVSSVSYTIIMFEKDEINFDVIVTCLMLENDPAFWVDAFFRCTIPFLLMLIGDICIIHNIKKCNKFRQYIISKGNDKVKDKEVISLTTLLLAASLTYILLTLPYIIHILFSHYTFQLYETEDEFYSSHHLWFICTKCLMYINNSVNFLLYCIGGTTFREEFLVMLGCHKRISPKEKVIEQARLNKEKRMKEKEKHQNGDKYNALKNGLDVIIEDNVASQNMYATSELAIETHERADVEQVKSLNQKLNQIL